MFLLTNLRKKLNRSTARQKRRRLSPGRRRTALSGLEALEERYLLSYTFTLLDPETVANAITASGQVAGSISVDLGPRHAFVWENGLRALRLPSVEPVAAVLRCHVGCPARDLVFAEMAGGFTIISTGLLRVTTA